MIAHGSESSADGFRTGIMVDWLSTWYASKQDFSELLVEDQKIRKFVKKRYARLRRSPRSASSGPAKRSSSSSTRPGSA